MHYDSDYGAYFDFGNHTEKVKLIWKEVIQENGQLSRQLVRKTFGKPKLKLVPHLGYVSFFPFMSRIIPPVSFWPICFPLFVIFEALMDQLFFKI
jgi:mannosyl-oligosaccharide glucosidase